MSSWWRSLALMTQDKILLSLTSLILFGRRRDDPVVTKSNLFLSQYISPLLQWDKTLAMQFMTGLIGIGSSGSKPSMLTLLQ
ncbi:hypothetical protein I7I48_08866 [Histoplasma ohiense]|nr:hypothetical protein I7I48_08866 [Histoplasma ohiense (nom. inval.)]